MYSLGIMQSKIFLSDELIFKTQIKSLISWKDFTRHLCLSQTDKGSKAIQLLSDYSNESYNVHVRMGRQNYLSGNQQHLKSAFYQKDSTRGYCKSNLFRG